MKLYNTRTRKKEEFVPIEKGKVGMYCCGPTVYWHQHIGNLRTYVFEDVLRRVLEYKGYEVEHVVNVTDVGHLTSDADEGEDKLMKAIKREGLPMTEESMHKIADMYFSEFKDDLEKLNIKMPDVWCKATDHITDMIHQIERIQENTYTYKTSVGLIFDTGKFEDYADFANLKLEDQEEGARGKGDSERRNPSDFALWLTNQPNHIMQWDSPWGRGFPGWHIECSAMSMKYLGEQFDIHCGGKEHIPVHHTNEIAQAEAATGKKPWVKYWLHAEWLVLQHGKMSKSEGTIYTLTNLMEKGYDPLVYRYFCFNAHYRSPLTFSFEAMDGAKNSFKKLENRFMEIKENQKGDIVENDYQKRFEERIYDDLDMPGALSLLWQLVKDPDVSNTQKYETILQWDKVFGFGFAEWEREEIPEEIKLLVEKREKAREDKNWGLADKLREEIRGKGFHVEDTSDGSVVKKI